MADKCKTCVIYRRISDVYREIFYTLKMIPYELKKKQSMKQKQSDSLIKKKVPGLPVSKEDQVDNFSGHERTHHY